MRTFTQKVAGLFGMGRLPREVEAQMGASPHTVHMVAAMYPGIALDLDKDEIAITDVAAFRARIERDLGK